MNLKFNTLAQRFTGRVATPTAPQVAVRPSCQPQPPPAQTVAEEQRSQVTPAPRKRVRWPLALAGVILIVGASVAAKRVTFYHPSAAASYNTRLAELDAKLSRALARQLRAAGYEFDAAIVSVEPPACQRAACLVKDLHWRDGHEGFRAEVSVRHSESGTWSFVGKDRLATLQFGVDAAAEMRRLAESTPPDIPQAATAAGPIQSQRQTNSLFIREFEIRMFAAAKGTQGQWVDLETGRCLFEPDWEYFVEPRAGVHWLRTNNMDLSVAAFADDAYGLFTRHLAVAPVHGGLWYAAAPEDIISHRALRAARQLPQDFILPARDETDTYLFRTEQGTIGILRLLDFNPASQELRIQYKLAGPAPKPDA